MSLCEIINEIENIAIVNRKHEILSDKFDKIIDNKDYETVENVFQIFLAQDQ